MSCNYATTARIASRQHGRVAARQLRAAGVDRHTIQRWLEDGRLTPAHMGVYAVGHTAPSVDGDHMAAVLACGEGAVLSHAASREIEACIARNPTKTSTSRATRWTATGRRSA